MKKNCFSELHKQINAETFRTTISAEQIIISMKMAIIQDARDYTLKSRLFAAYKKKTVCLCDSVRIQQCLCLVDGY